MTENNVESLRQQSLVDLNKSCQENTKISNKQESDANKLMFNLSTFMIPLSLICLSNEKITILLNILDKHLILISWFFLIISSILGILRLQLESKFFDKWAGYENKRADCFTESISNLTPELAMSEYEKMNQKAKLLVEPPHQSPKTLLIWQSILTGLGMILILIVLSIVLFKL